ncbi:MAG TPA: anhydro-N-acetylmuramic acid kinase [Holophagaceae bacterium]|nr:anhydro-N-acetylmuramic acid kinase [Holophagaceae bacterium]
MLPLRDLPGPWRVMGLMSGTSADGVDAVMIEVDPAGYADGRPYRALLGHLHSPYLDGLKDEVLAAASDRLSPAGLCVLQRHLGDHHATAAADLAGQLGLRPHLASLHGQTVQHHPHQGASLQLADPYVLAERLQCPVVWDLRRRDLALGGQGAPLVPLTERWLRGGGEPWLALNLGGIANATVWDGHRLQAWDLGPGMSLLDLAARRWLGIPFDPDGAYASGAVDEGLLDRWCRDPYFEAAPPKSTGRERFGAAWLESEAAALGAHALPDRLATLAAFSAEAAARELARLRLPAGLPGLISGGGARHQRVRAELARRLPGVLWTEDDPFPTGAREAVSWALLGAASALGLPGNLPEVTGASKPAVLGSFVLP